MMYTVCPKCTLALAVAAADLRAGQGYVRCGRCTNVFNALLNLRDETDTSPGLPLDDSATASFTPEPAPLAGEDRRASLRAPSPAPQPELDLDLSPPAMPAPPSDPEPAPAQAYAADAAPAATAVPGPADVLDLEVPDTGIEVGELDLTVPDPATDEPALDLVVESASADEPDLDIVFDPAEEHDFFVRPAPRLAEPPGPAPGEARILIEAPVDVAEDPPPPPPAPAAPSVAIFPDIARAPAANAAPPAPARQPAPPAPPAPPAAAAAAAPVEPPVAPPPRPARTSLPPQGLTPLSATPRSAPLSNKGLTPLHATASALKLEAGSDSDEFRGTGTYETIVLQGDSILQTQEELPEREFDERIAAVAQQLGAEGQGPAGRAPPAKAPSQDAPTASGSWPLLEQPEGDEPTFDNARAEALAADIAAAVAGLGPTEQQRQPRWLAAAAVVLALLLGLQAVHHWRNRLATLPALNGPLTRSYAALGETLAPEWDLAAYDLRLLGASADPADTRVIHVRLSLASHAAVAQALPLVRLRLIDRYGRPLSAGDLQPAQYLPPDQPRPAFLRPDQRIDSDVRVLDPTQQASSFELDVCLPRAGGGLHCASDVPFAGGHS